MQQVRIGSSTLTRVLPIIFVSPPLLLAAGIPVVIPLHLEVEDLALGCGGLHDEMLVEEGQHLVTNLTQLLLNLGTRARIRGIGVLRAR